MPPRFNRLVDLMRRPRHLELARFAVSSGASALLSLGLPVLLHEVGGLTPSVAVAISQASMLAFNYLLLRTFVFRSTAKIRGEAVGYLASAATFRSLEYGAFLLLFELGGIPYFPALLTVLLLSTLVKFVWYRMLFRRQGAR